MAGDIERLLLIRLSGTRMAIPLASVTEVTELPQTWSIPLVPGFFAGVMNSRGRLIPVLDLASWAGTGVGHPGGKALILDHHLADLALWVDDVERVIPLSDAALLREGEGAVASVLEIDDDEVSLISTESLLDMLETGLQGTTASSSDGSGRTA